MGFQIPIPMFDHLYRTIRVLVDAELDAWLIYYLELIARRMVPGKQFDGETWLEASLANLYRLFSWLASERTVRRRLSHLVKAGQIEVTKDPLGGPNLYQIHPSMTHRIGWAVSTDGHLPASWGEGQIDPGGRDTVTLGGRDTVTLPGGQKGEGHGDPTHAKSGQKRGPGEPEGTYTYIPIKKEPDEGEKTDWEAIRDTWNSDLVPMGYKPLKITAKFRHMYGERTQDQGFSWPELMDYLRTHELDPTLYGSGFNPEKTFLRPGWYLETKADGYHNWERTMDSKYHKPLGGALAPPATIGGVYEPYGWEDRGELEPGARGYGGYTVEKMLVAIRTLTLAPNIMGELEQRVKRAGWNAKTLKAVGLEEIK